MSQCVSLTQNHLKDAKRGVLQFCISHMRFNFDYPQAYM